ENLAYVLAVNRVGEGGKLRYAGDSAAISPWGEMLVEGGPEEAVLLCDVEPAVVRDARDRFPALKDRRPEAYRRWTASSVIPRSSSSAIPRSSSSVIPRSSSSVIPRRAATRNLLPSGHRAESLAVRWG